MKIPDNEVIALFVNFYKLLFLGTPFSRKVLKIKLEVGDKQIVINDGQLTDEEGRFSDGAMIEDTSEFISSDQGFSQDVGDADPY